MDRNYIFPDTDAALSALATVLLDGDKVPARQGNETTEIRHVGITLEHPLRREVLLPHRNADIVAQVAESLWVLAGRDDIEWLGRYLPRAHEFSDDGVVWRGAYGPRLRRWHRDSRHNTSAFGFEVDQVQHVVDLLRADPNSRRAVMAIYNPATDVEPGKDIPCNDFLSFSLRGGLLDVHVFVRSNDLIWGWSGINAFEWSVLQEVVAGLLGAEVGRLHFSITSLHVYDHHWQRLERISAAPAPRGRWSAGPRFETGSLMSLNEQLAQVFALVDMAHAGENVDEQAVGSVQDPLLQAFTRVLAAHETGNTDLVFKDPTLMGTRLAEAYSQRLIRSHRTMSDAATVGGGIPGSWSMGDPVRQNEFDVMVAELHADKDAAYGDSWRKRGELFSILPNVGRKVDRLASGKDTDDESQVDTAIDLLVYLIKYRWWLWGEHGVPCPFTWTEDSEVARVNNALRDLPKGAILMDEDGLVQAIVAQFDALLPMAEAKDPERYRVVDLLLDKANLLARHRVWKAGNANRSWNPEA